ncbi:hypothetical protein LJC49_04455 [Ruminococcaceae bacterium OttesenSCG-928-I18]|nr:hypothetical protein [Ruminococcaceae bacterium OttesenSCG-928-I18]
MSSFEKIIEKTVEQALLETHTAYLAQAVRFNGNRTTVQPLTLTKEMNGAPHLQPLVVDVPKLKGVDVEQGDVCLCVVCERDISYAMRGMSTTPAKRHHDLSDSVIVGVLEQYERV